MSKTRDAESLSRRLKNTVQLSALSPPVLLKAVMGECEAGNCTEELKIDEVTICLSIHLSELSVKSSR